MIGVMDIRAVGIVFREGFARRRDAYEHINLRNAMRQFGCAFLELHALPCLCRGAPVGWNAQPETILVISTFLPVCLTWHRRLQARCGLSRGCEWLRQFRAQRLRSTDSTYHRHQCKCK